MIAAKKYAILLVILTIFLTSFTPTPQTGPLHGRAKTQSRPALSGPMLTQATKHFLIHYTLEGDDAVSPDDADGNGLPDYVSLVAETLEFSWQREIEEMGWRLPLPDENEGGDPRLDVYLEDQGELFGYLDTYGGFIGDNPATVAIEDNTAYGYLGLDNNYAPGEFENELSPLDAMRTTVAHELHHAIQSAYDDDDPYYWLYEATAVWIEDEIYPEIGDAKSYLSDYMDAPDICPLSVGRDDQDVRWYASWILLRYISEHYGGPPTIQRLWEQMTMLNGLSALEATLAEQKTTLAEVLVNFSVANLTKSNCPANTPYCYAQGSDYLRPQVESSVRVDANELETVIPEDGVQQFGADYIRLRGEGPIQIDFRGSTAGDWQLRLVGLGDDQATVTLFDPASPTSTDPSKFEKLYLIVVNTALVEIEEHCGYHNYTLALAGTAYEGTLKAPRVPTDPGPYIPSAYDEAFRAPESLPEGGQPIDLEDAPFTPLYPGYLPPDYTFAQLVTYTSAGLAEWEQDYAPGGEPIIALEYLGPHTENYISISQSGAPYQSVADWVEAQDYYENDIRLVNDQPVHLVDYNEETGPFSTATFLHHDLFIVIDGTFDFIEMQQVVAGFLANNP